MRTRISKILIFSLFFYLTLSAVIASGQSISRPSRQQPVGRKVAEKYFMEDKVVVESTRAAENLLMLHIGKFVSSQAYDWGATAQVSDPGQATYGVTYLFDQWHGMDLNIRMDFHEFNVSSNRAVKIALLPLWTFPRVESRFPLYFGFGAGLGIFMQQVTNKSNLSLDYQLVMGARFLDITPGFGAFVEFGLKNHLHLLTNGQFNGTAFAAGAAFTF